MLRVSGLLTILLDLAAVDLRYVPSPPMPRALRTVQIQHSAGVCPFIDPFWNGKKIKPLLPKHAEEE
ncbi:hypothetical protein U8Q05_20425 [Rhizobium ruizarguesonis]|nr:hypothetical protein U8Q05_20425 [Rhizobium ruizarguesonis]